MERVIQRKVTSEEREKLEELFSSQAILVNGQIQRDDNDVVYTLRVMAEDMKHLQRLEIGAPKREPKIGDNDWVPPGRKRPRWPR